MPATQQLIDAMKGRLREADHIECLAMSRLSADEGMQRGFDKSEKCWVAIWKGEPVLCFGVRGLSLLSDKGVPWLLATDGIEDIGLAVVRQSKQWVGEMMKGYVVLENWVDKRNLVSKKWLKWCGFHLEKPEPFGFDKEPFHRFWMNKE